MQPGNIGRPSACRFQRGEALISSRSDQGHGHHRQRHVERQQGATTLTEIGRDVARRAARDLTDSARHSVRPLTGALRLGLIPTLAP
jgi:hypothetical protein